MTTTENEKTERRVSTKPPPRRNPLKKTLPTDRLSVSKQLDILRAYGACYEATSSPVTNNDIASIVELAPGTVALSNAFLVDVGLLERGDTGFTPAAEVAAFCHAYGWDEEKAPQKLGPLLMKTWFAQALLPRLKFRNLKTDEALQILAEASGADKDYTVQLRMLVEFLAITGNVINENGEIRIIREVVDGDSKMSPPVARPSPTAEQVTGIVYKNIQEMPATQSLAASVGAINFELKVNVNMAELSGWSADRITAFFNGVAQVLAAKADAEKEKPK